MSFDKISKIALLILLFHFKLIGQEIRFIEISLPKEIKSINELLVDQDVLYIATAQGLYAYSNSEFKRFYESSDEEAYRINALCPDRGGNLWFGTYNGLLVEFSGKMVSNLKDLKPYCKSDNYLICSISIDTIVENKNREILISTAGGELLAYDTLSQVVRNLENPGKGTIFAIKYGIYPLKWLYTTDGFYTMSKNSKWKKNPSYYTVYQISENKGKYWGIGRDNTKKAIFMLYFDEKGDEARFKWKAFDLSQLEDKFIKFNELAVSNGEIAWIVSDKGLIRYNPRNASLALCKKADKVDLGALRHIAIQREDLIWVSSSGRRLIRVTIE